MTDFTIRAPGGAFPLNKLSDLSLDHKQHNLSDSFNVLEITKKIQEQTRSIEGDIQKMAEIVTKRHLENSVESSISKQTFQRKAKGSPKVGSGDEGHSLGKSSPENMMARHS